MSRVIIKMSEKDQVLFIDSSAPPAQPSDPQSAFNEETGEINWVLDSY